MATEVWLHGFPIPRRTVDLATRAEARGFDGLLLLDGFLDRFAVVGDAETCAGRLRRLLALGLERFVMVPGSRDADPALVAESNELFASEVLPALRS